ncbi:Transcription factor AP4 [Desmophyllum pertusum]|uniref:Transcription factor AP4 n=1 Tax=Desmophyllum pertusum TaxID=174260 RepID=A0A9W9ZP59_9CNID|nr:Transcription factor AP4 [Desmophyllum pertusum]
MEMSFYARTADKRKSFEMDDELYDDDDCSFKVEVVDNRERERKLRREIANSNERRRMQSINSGFQALRLLIPHSEGEKLSKAAILQQTAEYIFALEQDKTRLLQQKHHFKANPEPVRSRRSEQHRFKAIPAEKAKTEQEPRAQENIKDDENNNVLHSDDYVEEIQKELIELRCQLERERRLRISVEEKKRLLELDVADAKSKSNDKPQKALATSRQNLDTIVQAIKHLEGEKPELIETPTKCKAEASTNGPSCSENTSRRLIV